MANDQVQKLVTGLHQQLNDLEAEKNMLEGTISQLRHRLKTGLASIEAEFVERRDILSLKQSSLESANQKELEKLARANTEANSTLQELTKTIDTAKVDVEGLNSLKQDLDTRLSIQAESLKEITNQIQGKQAEFMKLEADISDAHDGLEQAFVEQDDVQKGIVALQAQVAPLQAEITELTKQRELQKDQTQRELADIHSKLQRAINQLRDTQDKEQLTREALAKRSIELDNRERVVRKRELLNADVDRRVAANEEFMSL